jgi:ankyrin repeat protein
MKRRIRNKLKKRNIEELVRAIYEGHFGKVNRLVRSESDANYKDEDGWAPLHWATQPMPNGDYSIPFIYGS